LTAEDKQKAGMELSSILNPEAVKLIGNTTSKKRLLQDVCDLAFSAYGLDVNTSLEALLDRESLGPTGVGQGVALPHARLPDLTSVVGCFVRLEKPVDFGSVDRRPVDLIFALFAPANSGVDHLKALAAVSRTMRDPSVCQKLRANTDPMTLHAVLTETQGSQAA